MKNRLFYVIVIFGFCSIIINASGFIVNLIRLTNTDSSKAIAVFFVIGNLLCMILLIYMLYKMVKENNK